MSSEATGARFDLDAWRSMVTDRLLRFVAALGALVILSSVVQALGEPRWWSQTVPFLVVYGLLLGLTLLRQRIDYRIRAWGLLLAGYAAAVMYMVILGLLGNGVVFLVALPALGLIVLGRRSGIAMALLSASIYLFFTVAAAAGILGDWLILRENTLELSQWLSQGLSAGLILAALVALLARFSRAQATALAEARSAVEQTAAARNDLQIRTESLDRYSHLLETTTQISRQVLTVRDSEELLKTAADLLVTRMDVQRVAVYFVEEGAGPSGEPLADQLPMGPLAEDDSSVMLRLWPSSIVVSRTGDGDASLLDEAAAPLVQVPAAVATTVVRAATGETSGGAALTVDGDDGQGHSSDAVLLLRARGALQVVLHLEGLPAPGGVLGGQDLAALEMMADQFSVALENARRFEEAADRLRELDALQRHYTVEAWQRFVAERGKAAYHWLPLGAEAAGRTRRGGAEGAAAEELEETWRSLFERAQAGGQPVNVLDEDSGRHLLVMPVRLRDEVIGMVGFHRPRDAGPWQPEEIAAIEVVAGRMAFAAENLRLLEDAQRRAARDRLVSQVTARMRETLDVEAVLRTTADEMFKILDADEVTVRLVADDGG